MIHFFFFFYREKESDKLLTSQSSTQNGQSPAAKSPKQSPQNLGVQKKENLTVSSASHSSLSRPSDVPTLRVTEVNNLQSVDDGYVFNDLDWVNIPRRVGNPTSVMTISFILTKFCRLIL